MGMHGHHTEIFEVRAMLCRNYWPPETWAGDLLASIYTVL